VFLDAGGVLVNPNWSRAMSAPQLDVAQSAALRLTGTNVGEFR
jgi:hypothetical protein